jgi:N6-adenosine-specific RNA methylase IME4
VKAFLTSQTTKSAFAKAAMYGRERFSWVAEEIAGGHTGMTWPFHPLSRAGYGVIIADPPWRFVTWSETRQYKAPARHYAVMELDAIKSLPVADLAAPDCWLWLWATQAQLHQAIDVMECWGFDFKTSGAWAKQSRTGKKWAFGTGRLLRSAAEFFLIGTRGRPKPESRSERNLIVAPVREHSRKPDQAYEMLERMFPARPRCELFARSVRPGWDQWGLEAQSLGKDSSNAAAMATGERKATRFRFRPSREAIPSHSGETEQAITMDR